MLLPEKIEEIAAIVDVEDFGDLSNRAWYIGMLQCQENYQHVDEASLLGRFEPEQLAQIGGVGYLHKIVAECTFPYSWKAFADSVVETAKRRHIESIGESIKVESKKVSADELADRTQQRLDEMRNRGGVNVLRSFEDIGRANRERFDKVYENPQTMLGLSSGIKSLDYLTRGFRKGKTYIVLANTSMGKSTAAASFVANMDCPGLVVTTEMCPDDWLDKVVAAMAHVNSDKIATGDTSPEERSRIIAAYRTIEERKHCHIVDLGTPTAEQIASQVRMGIRLYGYKYLMVDSISNMSADGFSQIFDITSHVSHTLQALARSTQLPVIMTCQAKPEVAMRTNKIPQDGDTVGGGATSRDADVILSLYRHEHYVEKGTEDPSPRFPQGTAVFMVAKNRAGGARSFAAPVSYLPGIGIFDLENRHG